MTKEEARAAVVATMGREPTDEDAFQIPSLGIEWITMFFRTPNTEQYLEHLVGIVAKDDVAHTVYYVKNSSREIANAINAIAG
jgi:hypothetical protein